MTMVAEAVKETHEDREQAREKGNVLRIVGGLFVMMALLLYFFHLAEVPMGGHMIGVLAAAFGAIGVVLLWVGQVKIRALR
jgi:hypothetical protein